VSSVTQARFPAKRNARNATDCVRCVNENRKQRKHLIGCFDDWLFRSTIPIGWRLHALCLDGNWVLRNVFDCVIFLRLLRTFLTQSVALHVLRLAGNRASVHSFRPFLQHTDTSGATEHQIGFSK